MLKLIPYLLLLFTVLSKAQEYEQPRLQIGADIGYAKNICEVPVINSNRYKAWDFIPVHFRIAFEDKDGFNFLNYHQQKTTVHPVHESVFFDENKIDLLVFELSYQYLFRAKEFANNLTFFAGAGYLGHFSHLTQYYDNSLYYYADGTRYSFEMTAAGLTANIMLDYENGRHLVRYKASYNVLNYVRRPDDYTASSGYQDHNKLHLETINKYTDLDMSLQYHYSFGKRVSFYGEHFFRYLSYFQYPESKFYKFHSVFGLTFKFF